MRDIGATFGAGSCNLAPLFRHCFAAVIEVRRSMAQFRWSYFWSCILGSCVLAVSATLGGAAQAQRTQAAVQAPPQAAPEQSAPGSTAGRAPEMRIAAVVNDQVVSV